MKNWHFHEKIELQCSPPSQFSPIQSMKTKNFEESTNTAFEEDSSKLLAKVLANRIKKVMGKVISSPKMPLWRVDRFWM